MLKFTSTQPTFNKLLFLKIVGIKTKASVYVEPMHPQITSISIGGVPVMWMWKETRHYETTIIARIFNQDYNVITLTLHNFPFNQDTLRQEFNTFLNKLGLEQD